MSKTKPTDPDAQASLDTAEADRLAAEQAEADRLARGVLQRRECIEGVWYPHGTVLTAPAALCEQLRADGALDMHPNAIEHALSIGAQQVNHERPEPAGE